MVYTILISVVFIAELIIALTIIQNLTKLDKLVLLYDETINEKKQSIKDICNLSKKISEQWIILAEDFVENAKSDSEKFVIKLVSKILISLLVINMNWKIVKKIRKSKVTKFITKGYSIIGSML